MDSLQTVWSANTPLFKDLYAFSCMEKQHLKKCFIALFLTAENGISGYDPSPGSQLSRTSVALLVPSSQRAAVLYGLWVCTNSGVGIAIMNYSILTYASRSEKRESREVLMCFLLFLSPHLRVCVCM